MRRSLLYSVVSVCILTCSLAVADQADTSDQKVSHAGAGEFVVAQRKAELAPIRQRDQVLAQLASQQGYAGEPVAAARTMRSVDSAGNGGGAVAGAGGGSFADFGSLMSLIETTVVPDTWEALGGPSTMAPYPQGVYVDADGTVKECEFVPRSDALDDLKTMLRSSDTTPDEASWRHPSHLRVVSLRRLKERVREQNFFGRPASEAVLHLAGLSQVKYLLIDGNDILIAGPVGGIEKVDGWYRDQATGLNTLRSDFLFTCLASAIANRPFGCTIDPTPLGLREAAAVAQQIQSKQVPIGKADEHMERALGMQRVEVFGTAGDTPIGYMMVEADRHMKQLALGKAEMPEGVNNYLDVIDDTIAMGPPNQLLLRLWFKAKPRSVRADSEKQVFELAGSPIELSGQNQRALSNGQRGEVTVDPRSDAFVKEFNRHWSDIRSKYPIYSALESVYRVASVSSLINRYAGDDLQDTLLPALAAESSTSNWVMPTPKQVASIATKHSVRHGRKVHHVVLASGGVAVDTRQTVASNITNYASLRSLKSTVASKPRLVQKWWWDVKRK